jgi:RNA-directed DNA polymerase
LQKSLQNQFNGEKQMTVQKFSVAGAAPASGERWNQVNWHQAQSQVHRLQMRIAKAVQQEKWGKVKALQWLLTHSHHAKLLAVKRVSSNAGAKTSGIDKVRWQTPKQKYEAVKSLRRRGYKAQALRRIYIPKKNDKLRPLGIPTMRDRAMQALYLLALEPVAEIQADKNSYGFRPKRSAADATGQCFLSLSRKTSAQWIFEGDIKACFDEISHSWLMENVLMDKTILQQWLTAGYMENGAFYDTESGTPQGGIISPALANLALDGLEDVVKQATDKIDKVNIIRYADDFVITGNSKEILEQKVKPVVMAFLIKRGLMLSETKTHITHIDRGFDFLGFNLRKYNGKLLIKPSKKSIKTFLADIRSLIKSHRTIKTENLIRLLNPKLRGWANYFRHVVSKEVFSRVDTAIFKTLYRWVKRRHRNKNAQWRYEKYFKHPMPVTWWFHTKSHTTDGKPVFLKLFKLAKVKIERHLKIKADATPYDSAYTAYFSQREARFNFV